MKNNNETEALNQAIIRLNHKRVYELQLLKEQFQIAYESLKPINIIKNTFQEVASSPTVKKSILNTAMGIGVGFLSKKFLIGNSHNPIKKLFGTFLEFAVARAVTNIKRGNNVAEENSATSFSKNEEYPNSTFSKTEMHNF